MLNVLEGTLGAYRKNNLTYLVTIYFAGILLYIRDMTKLLESITILIILGFSTIFIYIGGVRHIYYALPLVVVIIPGIGMFLKCIHVIPINSIAKKIVPIVLIGVATIITLIQSQNTYLMKYEKKDLPQYKFAEIINKKENPTLLNYDFLDGGFYTTADILASEKYFCKLNVFNEELNKQHKMPILDNEVDFVVIKGDNKKELLIECGYKEVSNAEFYFEGHNNVYYLYEK